MKCDLSGSSPLVVEDEAILTTQKVQFEAVFSMETVTTPPKTHKTMGKTSMNEVQKITGSNPSRLKNR